MSKHPRKSRKKEESLPDVPRSFGIEWQDGYYAVWHCMNEEAARTRAAAYRTGSVASIHEVL